MNLCQDCTGFHSLFMAMELRLLEKKTRGWIFFCRPCHSAGTLEGFYKSSGVPVQMTVTTDTTVTQSSSTCSSA